MFEGKARRHETWWPLFFLIPFLLPVIVFWFVTIGTFWKVQRLYEEAFEEWFAGPATASDTVVVRAPAGSLGVFFARWGSVTEVRASGPLAGRVAVGDRLVSISTPGRALFTCGPTATGPDIVDELRAGAGSDGRVLTFARRGESALVSPVPFCCEPSRTCFIAMAMGCPCFIVAVILFIMNEIFYHSPGGAVISIFLLMLSAAGCVAGCCCAAICSATPPGDDDVEAPAAVAAPRV